MAIYVNPKYITVFYIHFGNGLLQEDVITKLEFKESLKCKAKQVLKNIGLMKREILVYFRQIWLVSNYISAQSSLRGQSFMRKGKLKFKLPSEFYPLSPNQYWSICHQVCKITEFQLWNLEAKSIIMYKITDKFKLVLLALGHFLYYNLKRMAN